MRLVERTGGRARAWSWFCGYCGAQPEGARPAPFTRVCDQCGLGLLLETPTGAVPHDGEPYFVVDRELLVRAVSKSAERALQVREPEIVLAPVDEVLPLGTGRGRLELAIRRAAAGDDQVRHALVRAGAGFQRRRARISCCGPPAAALVVLEPWDEATGQQQRR
jgi:hypothetical protein